MNDADNTPSAAAPAGALTECPGRLLARSRQAQNLSVADVARQLKLSGWQIEALEEGHYHKLPGPVFVRGFVRNYARLLRLDPEALLRSAGDSLRPPVPRPEAPPSQDIPFPTAGTRRWRKYAITIAVAVAALAVYEFTWNEPETVVTRVAVAPAPAVTGAAIPLPADEARAGQPALTAAAAAAATAHDAPSSAAGALRDYDRLPRPGERQVRMVFDQESWVEIRDRSGRAIFSRLNRPGTEQSVNGLPPLALVVGNAHGVRLTYDDQPVDLARHTKIDVARFTLP